jgi:hypothetical protein
VRLAALIAVAPIEKRKYRRPSHAPGRLRIDDQRTDRPNHDRLVDVRHPHPRGSQWVHEIKGYGAAIIGAMPAIVAD